jgi:hypothetical protein
VSGTPRQTALTQLATQLDSDATGASGASGAAKVRTLASALRKLAAR